MHATENACEHRWTDRVVLIQFDGSGGRARREGGGGCARGGGKARSKRALGGRARSCARGVAAAAYRRRHTGRARRAPPQAQGGTRQGEPRGALVLSVYRSPAPRARAARAPPLCPTHPQHTHTPTPPNTLTTPPARRRVGSESWDGGLPHGPREPRGWRGEVPSLAWRERRWCQPQRC